MSKFVLGMSTYADELVKLGFSERLYCAPEDCKIYLEHCNKNNMIWLDGSYGTIVNEKFNNFFNKVDSMSDKEYSIYNDLRRDDIYYLLDHTNFLKLVDNENDYILTSSPYKMFNVNIINILKKYPYNVYIIHPNFLTYHAFILGDPLYIGHPFYKLNYAFTKVDNEIMIELNKKIYDSTGVPEAFVRLI